MPTRHNRNHDWKPDFLAALAESPNVSAAAKAARVSRVTVYAHRKGDPAFAEAWDDALNQSTDTLIGEMYRRAVHGVDKPVYQQGVQVGSVREYSDTLAIFLAKSHRREVYGDKSQVEMSGPDGSAIPISIEQAISKVYGDSDSDSDEPER